MMDSEEGIVVAFDYVQNSEAKPMITQLFLVKIQSVTKDINGKRTRREKRWKTGGKRS